MNPNFTRLLIFSTMILSSLAMGKSKTGFCYRKNPMTNQCNRLYFYKRVTREECCNANQYFSEVPDNVEAIPMVYAKYCQSACEDLGYCYAERSPLGMCRNLVNAVPMSRALCCQKKLFFHAARQTTYNDWIDIPQETSDCEPACRNEQGLQEACKSISCPRSTQCVVKEGLGPVCRCQALCNLESLIQEEIQMEEIESQSSSRSHQHGHSMNLCTDHFKFLSVCQMYMATCLLNLGMPKINLCSRESDCSTHVCGPGKKCYLDALGRPNCGDSVSDEVECSLPLEGRPLRSVCASNNVTFSSLCALKQHNIRTGYSLVVAYLGSCRADAQCENIECPKSGMSCARHVIHRHPVCVDCKDSCTSSETEEFLLALPSVCSSSHFSWTNACSLRQYICSTGQYEDVMSQPPCLVKLRNSDEFKELLNATSYSPNRP